jgi:hypothetical protein
MPQYIEHVAAFHSERFDVNKAARTVQKAETPALRIPFDPQIALGLHIVRKDWW